MGRFDDCEWFALLECNDELLAANVVAYFSAKRHKMMALENQPPIMICEVEHHERFVLVYFNGDAMTGYSVFFQWVEESLHDIALIRVAGAEERAPYDPLDLELQEDGESMRSRSSYYQEREALLVRKFVQKVVLFNYTSDTIQRIVRMCCLGADPHDAVHYACLHLLNWRKGDRSTTHNGLYWLDAIRVCNTTGPDYENWADASNLMARVLCHLLYLEELNPTPFLDRLRSKNRGVQRMSLT